MMNSGMVCTLTITQHHGLFYHEREEWSSTSKEKLQKCLSIKNTYSQRQPRIQHLVRALAHKYCQI
jgi:hypothetical protein